MSACWTATASPPPEAVVLVDSSVQGTRPAPVLEASITQEYLKFVPAVTVVSPGAKITFSNRDGWDHHIILGLMGAGASIWTRGRTPDAPRGRTGVRTASETRALPQPGAYLLGCHIHGGSMRGHIYVADSPWAKLTNSEGKAAVQGTYPRGQCGCVSGTPTSWWKVRRCQRRWRRRAMPWSSTRRSRRSAAARRRTSTTTDL